MSDLWLHEVRDEHFAWLLGNRGPVDNLTEAPGGIEDRFILSLLRDLTGNLHQAGCHGHWLIIDGMEVVGLGGFKRPPNATGGVEIGYGIATSRRRRGYAFRAVALMVERSRWAGLSTLTAETGISNVASQSVLARNDFIQVGSRNDVEDGDLVLWAITLSERASSLPGLRSAPVELGGS